MCQINFEDGVEVDYPAVISFALDDLGDLVRRAHDIESLVMVQVTTVGQAAQAAERGAQGSWLAQMLARKPKMLVAVALASKMARIVWALLIKGGIYTAPVAAP
jgi:hypothetical protein